MFPKSLTLTALLALGVAMPAAAEEAHGFYRVFVADHAAASVTAIDLARPENRWQFATSGQAKPQALAGGAVVALVQSDADAVQFVTSGVRLEDHGDHADLEIGDPALLGRPLTGPRPFHLVLHDGQAVIHYDKGAYAEFLSEAALQKGEIAPRRFDQARAHHGFVTPFGPVILSTVASDAPVEGDAAPPRLGLQAFDASGKAVGDLAPCTAIHGEAFSGNYLAAGCREGVLTARLDGDRVVYQMLPYPADFPPATTGTLHGLTGLQAFLGNHGPDGLSVIDPAEEPHMRRIALPTRRVDFLADPVRPGTGWALTEDGQLHRIDVLGAAIAASAPATAPYSMEGHWNDPRPRLAVAGDEVLVTDPQAGLLRRFAADTLAPNGTIDLGGLPYTLAVVGGSGAQH